MNLTWPLITFCLFWNRFLHLFCYCFLSVVSHIWYKKCSHPHQWTSVTLVGITNVLGLRHFNVVCLCNSQHAAWFEDFLSHIFLRGGRFLSWWSRMFHPISIYILRDPGVRRQRDRYQRFQISADWTVELFVSERELNIHCFLTYFRSVSLQWSYCIFLFYL